MKRFLFLMLAALIFVSAGCQEGPKGDPKFEKKEIDMEKLKPVQGEQTQKAPEM